MSGSSGILSPTKTPNDSHHGSPEEGGEDVFSSRAKELADAKSASKCVRVMTVMAYVLSVSMAAILLSLYYVFLWDPQPPLRDPSHPMALRDDPPFNGSKGASFMAFHSRSLTHNDNQNGNSTVQVEKAVTLPFDSENSFFDSNSTEDSTDTNTLQDAGFNITEEVFSTADPNINLHNKMSNSILITKISRKLRNDTKSNNT